VYTKQSSQMKFTVTKLKTRKPRKGELWSRSNALNTGGAVGIFDSSDVRSGDSAAVGGGKGQTITRVTGIGKEMVRNLDRVKSRARSQYLADRRAFVNEGCAVN